MYVLTIAELQGAKQGGAIAANVRAPPAYQQGGLSTFSPRAALINKGSAENGIEMSFQCNEVASAHQILAGICTSASTEADMPPGSAMQSACLPSRRPLNLIQLRGLQQAAQGVHACVAVQQAWTGWVGLRQGEVNGRFDLLLKCRVGSVLTNAQSCST